jgi:hypothetical protein
MNADGLRFPRLRAEVARDENRVTSAAASSPFKMATEQVPSALHAPTAPRAQERVARLADHLSFSFVNGGAGGGGGASDGSHARVPRAAPRVAVAPSIRPPGKFHVVVIGAGVAGLTAAAELAARFPSELDVTVVEASARVGGRVKQDDCLIPGHDIEIGAEFLHGDNTPVGKLASRYKWASKLVFTWSQGDGGPSEEATPDGGAGYYFLAREARLLRFDEPHADMQHLHKVLREMGDRPAAEADADARTLEQYLRAHGVADSVMGESEFTTLPF